MDEKIRLSINVDFLNKVPRSPLAYADGWRPHLLTPHDLIDSILRGHAFAPVFTDAQRRGENFLESTFIAADFDGDQTINGARDNAFINAYASFIYTTPSHTADAPRFRVVFILGETVTDGQTWANANLGLAHRLGSDSSISDAARCFFGSTAAQVWRIGHTMPHEVFTELADYGKDLRAARTDGYSINSTKKVSNSHLIRLASGECLPLNEIPLKTSVHCPYHDDRKPSAFIVPSWKFGGVGIHCRACGMTYWQSAADDYDFDAFDKLLQTRMLTDSLSPEDRVGLGEYFPPDPKCTVYSARYLPPVPYQPGITLIKSPKGTGKTEFLKHLISDIKQRKYAAGVSKADRIQTILLIGHRRALLREAANKLGLNYYREADVKPLSVAEAVAQPSANLDNPMQAITPNLAERKVGLAVCLDSLPVWNESYIIGRKPGGAPIFTRDKPYDLVILDESEQVLSHLTGDTIRRREGGIQRVYDALRYELESAKAVIALDADLGMLTAHALKHLRPTDWKHNTRIIYNKPTSSSEKRTLDLYVSETALREKLLDCIRGGKKCFVTTNSKRTAKVLEKIIRTKFGTKIKMRTITSDNSQSPDELHFVKNIREEILKIQVLICSPSLGTGIDITFPDPEGKTAGGVCKVDHVFGFFHPKVNTHTEMDQQLARVRNPGAVSVWISPARFQFASNFDVVRDDLGRSYYVPSAVKGRGTDGQVIYDPEHPLLMICAHVGASQRASKNRLIDLFCALREANDWTIRQVVDTSPKNKDRSEAERALWNENAKALLAARRLDDAEYLDLCARREAGEPLSKEERCEYERNALERALNVILNYDIIKLNYDGRLEERLGTLSAFTGGWKTSRLFVEMQLKALAEPLARLPKMAPPQLLSCVLSVAGLCDDNGLNANVKVEGARLAEFVTLCQRNRTLLEEFLKQPLRKDIAANPVRQLNAFLKLAGLRLVKTGRHKKGGLTARVYGFEQSSSEIMWRLAEVYRPREEVKAALLAA